MPTCRRKRVILTEPSQELLEAAQHDPDKEVYYLAQTGEIFETYEAYSARMSFYRLKQFQCEVTGKSGLDYFQALESEQQEARTLHSRFPEPLKAAVLRSVQWQIIGRLDHLVEAIHERYRDRYFEGEKIFVDVQGDKYSARVMQVFPPKSLVVTLSVPSLKGSNSASSLKRKRAPSIASDVTSSLSPTPDETPVPVHVTGGNMDLSLKECLARDDPTKYFYKVQIIEEDRLHRRDNSLVNGEVDNVPKQERRESGRVKERESQNGYGVDGNARTKWGGSLMEVQCNVMSRDRLVFSKSLLRRFLRECLDRDSTLAAPWIVKPAIAQKYNIASEMPDAIRADVERIRQDEIDKRKKIWEEKELQAEREGRYTKKMKKRDEREAKAAAKAVEVEARHREAEAKATAIAKAKADKLAAEKVAKEEAERLAAEKARQRKKPIRYPTEDLDIRLSDRDKKAGMKLERPVPHRSPDKLPFSDAGCFEKFIATWNFLICFGQPLHLSMFTLDDYEHALRHSLPDLTCSLLAEIHSVLIYNLRTVPFSKHAAVMSLLREDEQHMSIENYDLPTVDNLTTVLADAGNNWERVPLKHGDGRVGWEEALLGCLKDHATVQSLPGLRQIFSHLLLVPESSESSEPSTSSALTISSRFVPASPSERYYSLPPSDRLAILQFLCDATVSSKAVHQHLEHCEEQLTALRKEKIEINRLKRQYSEEMAVLMGDKESEGRENSVANEASDVDSESIVASEDASEVGSATGRRTSSSSRLTLRLKAQQGQAKQRELARAKLASQKQAQAEHRRLDEEVNKLERRLEGIEREFRKLLGVIRVKPIGRDRFYNRIWWFDGLGTSSLVGSGGAVQYSTGRIFIQGPSEFDQEILDRREAEDGIRARRLEEEGVEGVLAPNEWGVYTDLEEMDAFVAWLNPKGNRELALKNALSKWWDLLAPGVRKRTADLALTQKLPEARRSQRGKNANSDISRESYMLWTNRKAVN